MNNAIIRKTWQAKAIAARDLIESLGVDMWGKCTDQQAMQLTASLSELQELVIQLMRDDDE